MFGRPLRAGFRAAPLGGRGPIRTRRNSDLPAWRRDMTANTVAAIGNTLSSINPASSATYNPDYPSGSAPWSGTGGQPKVVSAWCGAVFDTATDTLHIPLAGGHADYGGNEPYSVCLYEDSPAWRMLRAPSGAVDNTITLNDGQEATGLYSDGRLRAVHSYSNHCYVPGHGPLITTTSAHYFSASGRVQKCFVVDEVTGEAAEWADWTSISGTDAGGGEGAACYDSTREVVWFIGSATARMCKVDVATRTPSTAGTWDNHLNGSGSGGSMRYMPSLDLIAMLKSQTNELRIFDPATGTRTIPAISGSFPSGYATSDSAAGIDWDDANQRLLLWNQTTSNTGVITVLTPPVSSPDTGTWTVSTLTFTGATVSNGRPSGAFGRFAYSPRLKGCVLLNATDEQLYFFATE